MPRVGGARPGAGRPKGSVRTAVVLKLLAENNFEPVLEAIQMFRDESTGPRERTALLNMLLRVSTPTLQAVEIDSTDASRRPEILEKLLTRG